MVDDFSVEITDIEVQYLVWSDTSELKVWKYFAYAQATSAFFSEQAW